MIMRNFSRRSTRLAYHTSRPATTKASAATSTRHTQAEQPSKDDQQSPSQVQGAEQKSQPNKTQQELDDELMKKLAGISGGGGESGVEYEDGKPVAMKRGVKNNMFRLI